MSGQFSIAIPVGASTPIKFTLGNNVDLLVVTFVFEDANHQTIEPAAGTRLTTLRFRLGGYLPDVPPSKDQDQAAFRQGNPASFEIPAIGSGTYRLGGLTTIIELSSVQTIVTPGASFYRYLISSNPAGFTSGG